MRVAVLFGLCFIGANIGGLNPSAAKVDVTALFAILLFFCAILDVAEFIRKARR